MRRIITINSNQLNKSINTREILTEKLIDVGFEVTYDFCKDSGARRSSCFLCSPEIRELKITRIFFGSGVPCRAGRDTNGVPPMKPTKPPSCRRSRPRSRRTGGGGGGDEKIFSSVQFPQTPTKLLSFGG